MQDVVGAGVGGKPVLAVDLFTIGHEGRAQVFFNVFLLLAVGSADLGHGLAAALHDLKIAVVNPEAPLKIAVALLDGLRGNIKNIGVDLIHVLLADVQQVVLGQVVGGQNEGHHGAEVFEIRGTHGDVHQGGLRGEFDVLQAAALVVVSDVLDQSVFAAHG